MNACRLDRIDTDQDNQCKSLTSAGLDFFLNALHKFTVITVINFIDFFAVVRVRPPHNTSTVVVTSDKSKKPRFRHESTANDTSKTVKITKG